jgi:tellurite resistance protein
MAKKKGGGLGVWLVGGLLLWWLLASLPKPVLVAGGLLLAVGFVLYLLGAAKKVDADSSPPEPVSRTSNKPSRLPKAKPAKSRGPSVTVTFAGEDFGYPIDEQPVSVPAARQRSSYSQSGFTVPVSRDAAGEGGAWVRAGQATSVAGVGVPGGMVYVGSTSGHADPSLIDPKKTVASKGDYTVSQMGYWPSYSSISPTERRSYLNWLADGRKDPDAEIGYVFLFFYGLERRAVVDARQSETAKADLPGIAQEVRRLLGIYGGRSGSFRGYATRFLDWIALVGHADKLYLRPVPDLESGFELPVYMKLALGQCATDAAPVPPALALAWARLDPNISLRTPATRCKEEFEKLFLQKYAEKFGAGIVIKRNRTKLKVSYHPASSGLRLGSDLTFAAEGVPDVTALTAPVKQLDGVVEEATKALESFSRMVGKTPELRSSIEGFLLLPPSLWPESAQKSLQALAWQVQDKPATMTFQKLLETWGTNVTLNKDKALSLARALEASNVGMEPDILGGSRVPKAEDNVVLFFLAGPEKLPRGEGAYQAAGLTLQLASAVANADGEFGDNEMDHLATTISTWQHLTPAHIKRLEAHLHLLRAAPVTLASLKKKTDAMEQRSKETIAAFLATVAQADGEVSPAEVKMLEKVYKALGVDPNKVFTDVHAVAAGTKPTATTVAAVEATGFKLDPTRIAELQKDTDKVSSLLANIFTDAEEAVASGEFAEAEAQLAQEVESDAPVTKGLMGLDEAHSALARLLLSRADWSREDLSDAAADLDLMLDGSLEQINEAAFDAFDMPFFEGEDPITVNTDILERIEA